MEQSNNRVPIFSKTLINTRIAIQQVVAEERDEFGKQKYQGAGRLLDEWALKDPRTRAKIEQLNSKEQDNDGEKG